MKKVLGLLFISASIFSMQLDTIGTSCERIKRLHYQLSKHTYPKSDLSRNRIKEYQSKINDKTKQPIQSSSFSAPKGLGDIKLYHSENGFQIEHKGEMHQIKQAFTDKLFRKVTSLEIENFQKVGKGYFHITQRSDSQFELKVMDRLPGGGPVFGLMVYWVTKSFLYGTIMAGVGGVVVTAGTPIVATITANSAMSGGAVVAGKAAVATKAAIAAKVAVAAKVSVSTGVATNVLAFTGAKIIADTAIATTVVTATSIGVASTTLGPVAVASVAGVAGNAVATGTGLAAAVITGAGLAPEAAAATGSALASGMSWAGIVAGIEWVSIHAGVFCGMAPTL